MLADLIFLKNEGWDQQIKRHIRYGGKVLGICGGMQMLGSTIYDPNNIESSLTQVDGLAICDFETTLTTQKVLTKVVASLVLNDQQTSCSGYEIHAGISRGNALANPLITFSEHPHGFTTDGFVSADNAIAGTYLHGLFDEADSTAQILKWVKPSLIIEPISIDSHREQQLERLAGLCETHLNIEQIISIYEGCTNDRKK